MIQGDIVLVPFPFSDLSSIKTRPALIISNNSLKGEDIILCGITSQKSNLQEIKISNQDLSKGELPLISYIKFTKVVSLKTTIIKRTVAHLKDKKMTEVIEKLKSIIEKKS